MGAWDPDETPTQAAPKKQKQTAHDKAQSQVAHALAPFVPLLTGARNTAAHGVGTVLDLLGRPGLAAETVYSQPDARHPHLREALQNFLHGAAPGAQDQYRAGIRHNLGLDDPHSFLGRTGTYQHATHGAQGLVDAAIDAVADPLTLLGGSGLLENVSRRVAPHVLPAVLKHAGKATDAIVHAADRVGHGVDARQFLDSTGENIGAVYDWLGPGNKLKRQLATRFGAEGDAHYAATAAARNASRSTRSSLTNELVSRYRQAIHGLSMQDESAIYNALHTGTEAKLAPELQQRAAQISELYDTVAHLQGTAGLQRQLAAHGFQLPEWAQAFEAAKPRRIQRASQYRRNYLPTAHDDQEFNEASLLARQAHRRARYASSHDPNLLARAGNEGDLLDPDLQRLVNEGRFANAAKSIVGRDTSARMAQHFGTRADSLPGAVNEYLSPAFKEVDPKLRAVSSVLRGAVDLPKQALFALPFRHALNITGLQALHDPGAVLPTFAEYSKLIRMTPAERHAALQDVIHAGAVDVPSVDRARGLINRIPGVGQMYDTSAEMLWTFDDAAKAVATRRAMRRGLSPEQASRETLNALINYGDRSGFTDALGYVAPFATYRSKMPGAVARSLLKHPERTQIANRIAPALAGEEQPSDQLDAKGQRQAAETYLPLSDTLRAVDEPAEFARATASYPIQMLLSAAGVHGKDSGGYRNFFTYGKPVGSPADIAKYAGNAVPYLQQILQWRGLGEFPDKGLEGVVSGQTGVRLGRASQKKKATAAAAAAQALPPTQAAGRWDP